jgi:hypothetical protein
LDGFYEWKPDKSPVRFVRRRRELFCVAGLWKEVEKPGIDLPLAEKCFVLLTTAANPSVAPIHDPDAIHRSRRALRPRNKLGAYLPKIELMLQEDMALPRKQRHTAKRIWERLQTEGFTGGYTIVKDAVRELTQRHGRRCLSPDPPARRGASGFRGGAGEDEWPVAQGGVPDDGAALQ